MEGKPIQFSVDRDTAWRIYDLLVHEAITVENAEMQAMTGLHSDRFRKPANELREILEHQQGRDG